MKAPRLRFIAFTIVVFAVFVAGFLSGGIYASARAVHSANTGSLSFLADIHDALQWQNYALAATKTDEAVKNHAWVLRVSPYLSWRNRVFYVLPWTQKTESEGADLSLSKARRAYAAQPDILDFSSVKRAYDEQPEQLLKISDQYLATH